MKILAYRSPFRRFLASIVIVVGWYLAMYAGSWTKNIADFSAGVWSTNTAAVSFSNLLVVIVACALSVIVACLVGCLSAKRAGLLILVFWSVPMFFGYAMGALLSNFGPGGGATSEAAFLYILAAPLLVGMLTSSLNAWRESFCSVKWETMDSSARPFAWLFLGPLLHTPQGIACFLSCMSTLVAALLYVAAPSDLPVFSFRLLLFIWPAVLLGAFVMLGYRNGFRASLLHTSFIALLGAFPFFLPYVHVAAT